MIKKLEAKVLKIFFHNEKNFFTTMLINDNGETYSVSGNFPIIYEQAQVILYGNHKIHKKYGKQFKCSGYELLEPSYKSDLFSFLTCSFIKTNFQLAMSIKRNIGPKYLKIHRNIDEVYDLLESEQFDKHQLKTLSDQLSSYYKRKNNLKSLIEMGFDHEMASKLSFSDFNLNVEEVKKNPYILIRLFDLKWHTVDAIALKNGITNTSYIRISEGVTFLLNQATDKHAHMFLKQDELLSIAKRFLKIDYDLEFLLEKLESDKVIVRDTKSRIYSIENYRSEKLLAENLYRIHKGEPFEKNLLHYFEDNPFYSGEQKNVIKQAIENNLYVISGAAGTGKTTVLSEIINTLEKGGYDIELCAPTGRAAKRMTDVTGKESKTILRLLGFNKFTKKPQFNRNNQLLANCYIIDEFSMADLISFSYLLEAIPDHSKLILVGDVNQLPSIGPGRVMKDLIDYSELPVAELTTIFRQKEKSELLDVATSIRNKKEIDFKKLSNKKDFRYLKTSGYENIKAELKKLILSFLANSNLDIYEDLQIVSPIHKTPIGTTELNSYVQELINPNPVSELNYGDKLFRTSDKVIQTKNNYDKKIYNGDVGRIVHINKKKKEIKVDYYGDVIDYVHEELFELELAYVLTVHKLQGGECPFVIMPIHQSYGDFMLNQKLIYTSITRAKNMMIIIGDEKLINKSINNSFLDNRRCNLKTRLKEARLKHLFN